MEKQEKKKPGSSEFLSVEGIEYFLFEENFVEENIRCIPMIVRFKMDKAGIKLKLAEWSKFTVEERVELATKGCCNDVEAKQYHDYLSHLIASHTFKQATVLEIDKAPAWADVSVVPELVSDKLKRLGWSITVEQWHGLTHLQRFALLKLCKEGHEQKNLPKAMKEFKLAE